MYQGGYTGWSVPKVKMPGYSVPRLSFVHLSAVPVAVRSEIGAHAVATATAATASLHTLPMGRIIAHPANSRQLHRDAGQSSGYSPRRDVVAVVGAALRFPPLRDRDLGGRRQIVRCHRRAVPTVAP